MASSTTPKIHPKDESGKAQSTEGIDPLYGLGEIALQITRHGQFYSRESAQSVTIMEVMLSGGSYAEDAEERHRDTLCGAFGDGCGRLCPKRPGPYRLCGDALAEGAGIGAKLKKTRFRR